MVAAHRPSLRRTPRDLSPAQRRRPVTRVFLADGAASQPSLPPGPCAATLPARRKQGDLAARPCSVRQRRSSPPARGRGLAQPSLSRSSAATSTRRISAQPGQKYRKLVAQPKESSYTQQTSILKTRPDFPNLVGSTPMDRDQLHHLLCLARAGDHAAAA